LSHLKEGIRAASSWSGPVGNPARILPALSLDRVSICKRLAGDRR
jgi:hypothetical protein